MAGDNLAVMLPLRGPIAPVVYRGPRLLLRALVVVQFSPVLKIADQTGAGIAQFQEAARHEYPQVEVEMERQLRFEIGPDGVQTSEQAQPVWRMSDVAKLWRVSLSSSSLALETSGQNYTHWPEFADRIQRLIRDVGVYFSPAQKIRIGVRYINGGVVDGDRDPRQLCAPELASISGHSDLIQSDLLWRFTVDEGTLILRTGLLVPGNTHDPSALEPVSARTWYLDIDVVNDEPVAFDTDDICSALLRQVQRVHAVYRWAIPSPQSDEVMA